MIETKFKDSELGLIPEDWEENVIGSIGEPITCRRILKSQTTSTGDIPFYKIGTFGKIADSYINASLWRYLITHYHYPKNGDVLLSAAGTIGRCVKFDGSPSYYQDSNIVWIDNDESKLKNSLLYYLYSSLNWNVDSSTISRLYNSNLKSTKIVFPNDLDEQERIAEALSDVDALIKELDALIEKKRMVLKATMQDLLTARRRLPGFSEPWIVKTIDEICFRFDNLRIPVAEKMREKGSTPYYGANGIQGYVKGFTHNGEFILLAEDGANNLKDYPIQYVKGKIWVNNHAHVLSANENYATTRFLSFSLKCIDYEKAIVGGSRAKLNSSTLMLLNVYIPTSLSEQQAIAEILSDMDAEIAELEKKKEKYTSIRQGMMQQLLTGKIRLI